MISKLLQEHKTELYSLIIKNPSAKSKLKSMDTSFKQIEKLMEKDLKILLKGSK